MEVALDLDVQYAPFALPGDPVSYITSEIRRLFAGAGSSDS